MRRVAWLWVSLPGVPQLPSSISGATQHTDIVPVAAALGAGVGDRSGKRC
jgi:hypothetical protein